MTTPRPSAAQLRLLRWCHDGTEPGRPVSRRTVDACYGCDWIAFAGEEPYTTDEGERVLLEADRAALTAAEEAGA